MNLEGNKYFIGYCKHKEIKGKLESTPLYGMLFENAGLEESFYVGKINANGFPDTDNGLLYTDLNFNNESLLQELVTPSGITFPVKTSYKGEFKRGKFQGEGERAGHRRLKPPHFLASSSGIFRQDGL